MKKAMIFVFALSILIGGLQAFASESELDMQLDQLKQENQSLKDQISQMQAKLDEFLKQANATPASSAAPPTEPAATPAATESTPPAETASTPPAGEQPKPAEQPAAGESQTVTGNCIVNLRVDPRARNNGAAALADGKIDGADLDSRLPPSKDEYAAFHDYLDKKATSSVGSLDFAGMPASEALPTSGFALHDNIISPPSAAADGQYLEDNTNHLIYGDTSKPVEFQISMSKIWKPQAKEFQCNADIREWNDFTQSFAISSHISYPCNKGPEYSESFNGVGTPNDHYNTLARSLAACSMGTAQNKDYLYYQNNAGPSASYVSDVYDSAFKTGSGDGVTVTEGDSSDSGDSGAATSCNTTKGSG